MKTRYQLRQLSQEEMEMIEMVLMLMEELDMQTWYSISYSAWMDEEVFVNLN